MGNRATGSQGTGNPDSRAMANLVSQAIHLSRGNRSQDNPDSLVSNPAHCRRC